MDSIRVLLVDDERDIVDTVKYSLELRGYDVDACYDGETALKKARSGRYALVLLDVMLPGQERLRGVAHAEGRHDSRRCARVPRSCSSRRASSTTRFARSSSSTWSKADACLYKPFDLDGLLDRMSALLQPATV
jgi:DNA-binding response OmpR family regulator